MAKQNGLTKYAEKYLEAKFQHLHEEIGDVKREVKGIKTELEKNGKCLHEIQGTMKVQKMRIRHYGILITVIFILIALGFATGLEIFSKGILGFIR